MATLIEAIWQLLFGFKKAAIQVKGPDKSATLTNAGDVVGVTAHGFSNGDLVVFSALSGAIGPSTYTYYYVIGATTDTFQIATTSGGSAVAITGDGTGTLAKRFEYRLQMPNKITSTSDRKDVNYEGGDSIIKQTNLQSVGVTIALDCFPLGAHAALFGSAEVTSGLPDGYTSAYGLYGPTERTGLACGFWGEGTATHTDTNGTKSTKTVREWYPVGTLTPVKSTELSTSDKAALSEYAFNVTDMEPTVDIMGVALPVTGKPVIHMSKAA